MRMKKTVLAFGEVLWDILPTETVLGGAPCNFIYRINALGERGIMVSRLGADDYGDRASHILQKMQLDIGMVQRDRRHPTGIVHVSFDEHNNPSYVIVPQAAYDYIESNEQLEQAASTADCLCFGTVAQRSEVSRRTLFRLLEQCADGLKVLDINLRKDCYTQDMVLESLRQADLLKLNEDEAAALGDMLDIKTESMPELCRGLIKEWDLQYCLVTLEERGAFGISANDECVYVPGHVVAFEDPLGAGDAFLAGVVHHLLHGETLAEACAFGNCMGALVCTKSGATEPVYQRELEELANNRQSRVVDPRLAQYTIE
jgi:fructokinase